MQKDPQFFFIGAPGNLPTSQLPTYRGAVNYARLVLSGKGAKYLRNIVFKPVAAKVIEMWTAEGIPITFNITVFDRRFRTATKGFRR